MEGTILLSVSASSFNINITSRAEAAGQFGYFCNRLGASRPYLYSIMSYRKATKLSEVNNAVRFDVPVGPDDPFFTDFSDVRGDFQNKMIYRSLNVDTDTFSYDAVVNSTNKVLLFLAGMLGSGKTSELAKFSKKLNSPQCFFVVTCNLDAGLDLNDMEYMDILIFQLEQLSTALIDHPGIHIDEAVMTSLQKWFAERIEEINRSIKRDHGFELNVEAGTPSLFSFLKLAGKLRAGLMGTKENANKIRTVLKNNFTDFSRQINLFLETVNSKLRGNGIAREILFIVDGLEKTATPELRRKVIIEESERIHQVKANTIFTLPIELMPEARKMLLSFSTVVSFPFVKLRERDGSLCDKAIERFFDFTYKRIDKSLFDSEETVRQAILFGGGSPRELLRILQYAALHAETHLIDAQALEKGIKRLAAEVSNYITETDIKKLKELHDANASQKPIMFDDAWQDLLEKLIVLEYNDGNYKRVNPIVERSQLYQYYVTGGGE
jgi:hypothetical protein